MDRVLIVDPIAPSGEQLLSARSQIVRAPDIEETALVEALRDKRIAGAMLDVYEHYRLEPGHPLFSLDNAALTPHLSGMTRESRARMSVAAAEDILRMLAGEAPRHLVNPNARRVDA